MYTRPLRGLDGYSAPRHAADSGPYDRGIIRIVSVCLHVSVAVWLCVGAFVCLYVCVFVCSCVCAFPSKKRNPRQNAFGDAETDTTLAF